MRYFSSRDKDIFHGDLAARNVLLSENRVAKVSDFGLSKCLAYKDVNPQFVSAVSHRWTAPESYLNLANGFSVDSTEADIWSFGVVMWEIFRYFP